MIENLESVYFVNLASMEFHITHKKKKEKKGGYSPIFGHKISSCFGRTDDGVGGSRSLGEAHGEWPQRNQGGGDCQTQG